MRLCTVVDCDKKHRSSGLCQKHYLLFRRTGGTKLIHRAKGTGSVTRDGYLQHCVDGKRKFAHVAIAEAALGKPLPVGAQVHHWNGDRLDNRPANLVICPDQAYHALLHQRARALDACGNASWRRCSFCKSYDDPLNMKEVRNEHDRCPYYHRDCKYAYYAARKVAVEAGPRN